MNTQQAPAQDQELEAQLEERADYIPLDRLESETAFTDFYDQVHRKLVHTGTKLLSGPRGCGKTHLMRYTFLQCVKKPDLPLAVYASFNRYYRLEPLLREQASAISTFHTWMLAVLLRGLADSAIEFLGTVKGAAAFKDAAGIAPDQLNDLTARIERGQQLDADLQLVAERVTIIHVQEAIREITKLAGRTRAVLLLDDAALTLTREYLHEFFDVVRAIKTSHITPKASVYPGTTEYGPNFHAAQEAETVSVWLSPEGAAYQNTMMQIAQLRHQNLGDLQVDAVRYLMYAAFGVPRAFLVLLRGLQQSQQGTIQASVNRLIEDHAKARIAEYLSLKLKMPKFASIIEIGATLFAKLVSDLKAHNAAQDRPTMVVGLAGAENDAPVERVLSLLVEAGLLHELHSVSHGVDRTYRRFIVSLATLMEERAFSGGKRGAAMRDVVEVMAAEQTSKHPLRRSISTILTKDQIERLQPDLPECAKCHTARLSANQRFCHNCGNELVDMSAFAECMKTKVSEVPGLTTWTRTKLEEIEAFKTLGEFLADPNPAASLRKIHMIGETRAKKITQIVTGYVDEYLS